MFIEFSKNVEEIKKSATKGNGNRLFYYRFSFERLMVNPG